MATAVRELPLDLDAFEGPFDLLLTLVLREELELRDVDGGPSASVGVDGVYHAFYLNPEGYWYPWSNEFRLTCPARRSLDCDPPSQPILGSMPIAWPRWAGLLAAR